MSMCLRLCAIEKGDYNPERLQIKAQTYPSTSTLSEFGSDSSSKHIPPSGFNPIDEEGK